MHDKNDKRKTATRLTRLGNDPAAHHGAVNVPPYRVSTVVFPTYADFLREQHGDLAYGRCGTPSSRAFESAITALDAGAHASFATCSGLAAVNTALLSAAQSGAHILMPDNCYGPGRRTCEKVLRKYGVDVEYYPYDTGAGIAARFRPETRLLFMEAPGSITFEVPDIGAMLRAARDAGIRTAIDNSWGTPVNLKPLEMGFDIAVMSATKYIGGHSDAMLGIVSANEAAWEDVRQTALFHGYCGGSEELYLGLRGLRTLHLRLQRHQDSALAIATWLAGHPAVKTVRHPALPSCPGHENWKKYFSGATGTFAVHLHRVDDAKIAAMLDAFKLFMTGFSWGGHESLVFPEQPKREIMTLDDDVFSLRLHIGLEDVDDLKADLAQAFEKLGF